MKKTLPEFCGVIHLPPLPGSFRATRESRLSGRSAHQLLTAVIKRAVTEAQTFEKLGFDSFILENFGDVPFRKSQVAPETLVSLSVVAQAVRAAVKMPVGINVLRNDGESALAIAAAVGCQFVRVNVISGVAATDQGWIEGRAPELLAMRERLSPEVRILADVWVKHARQFSSDSLAHSIEETCFRAGADGVIITGSTTGRLASGETLQEAVATCQAHAIPLYLGSGVSTTSLRQVPRRGVSGIIVGSDLRKSGVAGEPLDVRRSRDWLQAARRHFAKVE